MNHQMTLFLANRQQNAFMEHFDLRPEFKWYVSLQEVDFKTTSQVNEAYFLRIIEESKAEKEMWIPAIRYMGNLFVDPSVKILSDGTREMFVT